MIPEVSRALAFFPSRKEVRIIEVPLGPLEEDEILVRMTRVGITRRDRLLLDDSGAIVPEGQEFIVPGHVAVGRVVATGALVRDFREGDPVVPTVRRDCNRCIDARSDLCPHPARYSDSGLRGANGFACEFLKTKSRYLIKLPGHLGDLGLLLTPMSIAEKAHQEAVQVMKRFNFYCYHDAQETAPHALVVGLDAVGIMTCFLLSLYNYRLTVFGRREEDEKWFEFLNGLDVGYVNTSVRPDDGRFHFGQIFETTGDPDYVFQVLPLMEANAVTVLMGIPQTAERSGTLPIPAGDLLAKIVMGNQVILGSIKAGRDAFESGVRHLGELADLYGKPLSSLLTQRFPLEEYERVLELGSREAVMPVLDLG